MSRYMARLGWLDRRPYSLVNRSDKIHDDAYGFCIYAIRFDERYDDWFRDIKEKILKINPDWEYFENDKEYREWESALTANNKYDDDGYLIMGIDGGVLVDLSDFDNTESNTGKDETDTAEKLRSSLWSTNNIWMNNMPADVIDDPRKRRKWADQEAEKAGKRKHSYFNARELNLNIPQNLFGEMLKKGFTRAQIISINNRLYLSPKDERAIELQQYFASRQQLRIEKLGKELPSFNKHLSLYSTPAFERSLLLIYYLSHEQDSDKAYEYILNEAENNTLLKLLMDIWHYRYISDRLKSQEIQEGYRDDVNWYLSSDILARLIDKLAPAQLDILISLYSFGEITKEEFISIADGSLDFDDHDILPIYLDAYKSGLPLADLLI